MRDLNQELAVEFQHRNIIVAAGAGTGKTESMTNRVVRNVIGGTSIRRILVLTFTNLAAAEMKGRIESKLRNAAYEMQDREEKKRLLEEAQWVDRAHIQTFHSFCVDLIREYHHYLETSPDFYVISDSERGGLWKEVFEEVFQSIKEENSSFSSFYEWYSLMDKAGKPDTLAEHVEKVFEMAENAVDFEEKLRDLNAYREDKVVSWLQENERMILKYEKAARQRLAVFQKFVEESPVEGNSGMRTSGAMLIDDSKDGKVKEIPSPRAVGAINLEKVSSRLEAVLRGKDESIKRDPLNRNIPEEVFTGLLILGQKVETKEEYGKLASKVYGEVKKAIDELKTRVAFKEIEHRRRFEASFDALASFVLLIKKQFDRAKAERNAIDFVDQEHKALALLGMDEVRASVRSKFEHVFVDENQDSSEIQDRIVSLVAGESLYRVGDVKQCIYAFRNADPKIFQRYIEEDSLFYDAYAPEKPDVEALAASPRVVIPLNTNFRTIQPILDFVNRVFREEMKALYKDADLVSFRTIEARMNAERDSEQTARLSETDAAQSKEESREDDGDSRPVQVPDMDAPVRVLRYRRDPKIVEEIAATEGMDPKDLMDVKQIEIEAEIVAREIKRMIEERGCKHKDCAVLLRNLSKRGNAFRKAFARYGIPLETQSEGDMLDFYEIATLASSIRAILNPYRDADFVNLLLSPFFEFTLEEMYQLSTKIRGKNDAYYKLFGNIKFAKFAVSEETVLEENASLTSPRFPFDDLPEALVEKVIFAYEKVNWLKGYSHYLTPSEFIWKLYDFNHFFDKIGRLPEGARRQENLKIYLDTVIAEGGTLDEIAHRERIKLPNSISEEADAVKLMTMHSSKGMGFPHVFLCDLSGKIYKKEPKARLMASDLGVAIKALRGEEGLLENGVFELAEERARRLVLEEEKRIMYVAMTRAKESLTILHQDGGSAEEEPEDSARTANGDADSLDAASQHPVETGLETGLEPDAEASGRILEDEEKEIYFDIIRSYVYDKVISYDVRDIEFLLRVPRRWKNPDMKSAAAHISLADQGALFEEAHLVRIAEANSDREVASEAKGMPSTEEMPGAEGIPGFENERILADANLAKARRANFGEKDYALEKGTEAHRELEHFDFKRLRTMSEEEVKKTAFSERKVVDRFLKSPFARRIAEADEIYKETGYVDDIGSGKTQGIIDLFFIEKGKIVLVDYKTDVYQDEEEKMRIVASYKAQLKRYKDVLERVYEREVGEVYLYLLHGEGQLVGLDFD